jgi:hypothetical protein
MSRPARWRRRRHGRRAAPAVSAAVLSTAAVLIAALCAGCPPRQGGAVSPAGGAPIERSTADIVGVIEENGRRLDRALWASSISVHAVFPDDRGVRRTYNLEGTLLYRPPRDLRIDLRPTLGEPVMGVGSNAGEYWLWIEPELRKMWWGRHAFAGWPCAGVMPVRPDQLAAALRPGLPTGEGLIGPVRVWGPNYDKLQYIRGNVGEAWAVDREYWVERTPPFMVRQVVFRDALGRVAVSARLDEHRPAWDGGPLMPHRINVLWPASDASFTLLAEGFRGVADDKIRPGSFDRPAPPALPGGVETVEQIDADCGPSPAD